MGQGGWAACSLTYAGGQISSGSQGAVGQTVQGTDDSVWASGPAALHRRTHLRAQTPHWEGDAWQKKV
eukprot:scaffold71668_cov44-Prasinocladus_malaysianus.AAC.1